MQHPTGNQTSDGESTSTHGHGPVRTARALALVGLVALSVVGLQVAPVLLVDSGGVASAAPGDKEWSYSTGANVDNAPTVVDGTVYVGSDDGNVYALDASSGTEEWSFTTGGQVASAPTVVDGTVYVGSTDNNVYALDAATGNEEWSYSTGNDVKESSPTVADGTVYIGSTDNNVYALDSADGSKQWSYSTGGSLYSSPTVADGTVYIGSYDNNKVHALDADDGSKQWSYSTGANVDNAPTVADGTVYIGSRDNNLYALDASTGNEEWSFTAGSSVGSPPTVVDGTVYIGSDDNNVYALEASDAGADSEGTRNLHGTLGHNDLFSADGLIGEPLSGTVTDADGNAVENATLEAINTSTSSTEATTQINASGGYEVGVDSGEYDVTVTADNYSNTTKTVDVPASGTTLDFCLGDCSSSSSGYTQIFELDDQAGKFADPTLTVEEGDAGSLKEGGRDPSSSSQWQMVEETSFNHNDRAYVDLKNDTYYLLSLQDGGAIYQQAGFKGNYTNDVYVIQPGQNESVNGTNVTATATPFNTSRDNVSVTPYDGGIRLTYDGEEPLDDFDYSLEGPDDKTYNVSRNFDEPTNYFQSDLEDPLIGNASEDSEEYEVDWNGSTTDGEELGGEIDVGENQGYEFGSSGSDSGGGGGGGLVPADSGGGSPIWVTAVPALAAIGYAVYRSRSSGV
jgi:outer membrane protein assembly factor BamB